MGLGLRNNFFWRKVWGIIGNGFSYYDLIQRIPERVQEDLTRFQIEDFNYLVWNSKRDKMGIEINNDRIRRNFRLLPTWFGRVPWESQMGFRKEFHRQGAGPVMACRSHHWLAVASHDRSWLVMASYWSTMASHERLDAIRLGYGELWLAEHGYGRLWLAIEGQTRSGGSLDGWPGRECWHDSSSCRRET